MYRYILDIIQNKNSDRVIYRVADGACIPFDPDNTDYQRFKIDLTNGAQLQDANSNVMTANQISSFLATLP